MRKKSEETELGRLQKYKQTSAVIASPLGGELVQFFKQNVEKRMGKFAGVGQIWARLIPPKLLEHCCLESLSKGTLTVLVDSSPHLYELKQLLLSGIEKQMIAVCKPAGLRKVALRSGRWYEGDGVGDRKLKF